MTLRRLAILGAAFVALTVLVETGLTDSFDQAILAFLLPFRSAAAIDGMQLVVGIGGPLVTFAIAIGLTIVLVMAEERHGGRPARGLVPLFLFAGFGCELLLKQIVSQPGPPSELVHDAPVLFSIRDLSPFTYPSGHAMRVAFLAMIVATRYPRTRIPLAIVVGLVAFGRVYLAAGWISDVAGGLLAGVALAMFAELIADRLGEHRPATREALVTP